ncbi:hypothetical protein ACERIT_09465 [Halopenitus sp. H-Gu1]|uniref:hypothetical protein n=1 Tax=Halopenitus sp. H-Gu1 TaxID=3242697 RepID=UPI00359E3B28
MADPHAATRTLLEERPVVADTVADALDVDEAASEPWTFEDVAADSGTFGELVSRGIVEGVDDGYRVSDTEAVRSALEAFEAGAGVDGGSVGGVDDGEAGERVGGMAIGEGIRGWIEGINPSFVGGLIASMAFLFVYRIITYRQVFREEMVTLPGNDPYHYLYWSERLIAADIGFFDLQAIAEVLGGHATNDPFTYILGWWMTALFGGGQESAIRIMAWIPVASALIVGALVAWMAFTITEDERIAVLAVFALALTPAHALYSGIGFTDHHTLDYLWIATIATGLVWLAADLDRRARSDSETPIRDHLRTPWTWLVAILFGIAVTAAAFTWNGSPVFLTGIAAYVFFRAGSDVRAGASPGLTAAPVAVGLAISVVLLHLIHTRGGLMERAVAYTPALLLGGLVAVVAIGETCLRIDRLSVRTYLGTCLAAVGGFVAIVWQRYPEIPTRFIERVGFVTGRQEIAESRRLFSGDFAFVFGSIDMFGWLFFLAFPTMIWVSWRCIKRHDPRWLVPCSFGWPLFGFMVFQIRFSGEFSPFAAIFTAVGTVLLFSKLDLLAPASVFGDRSRYRLDVSFGLPTTKGLYIAAGLILLASLSLLVIPGIMDTVAHGDSQVEAIEWMQEDVTEHDRPAFVLSDWGDQRLYNYHVFGDSDTYSTGAHRDMEVMLSSTDPDGEYDRFESGVGYLVLTELNVETTAEQGYTRLVEQLGSASGEVDGVGHYRAQFVASDGSVVVFTPVPGATINGSAPADVEPGDRLTVETNVSIPGAEFTYTRYATVDDDGSFSVTVAQPGSYEIGDRTVSVSEADVREGRTIDA